MTDGSGAVAALRAAAGRLDDLHRSPADADSDAASLSSSDRGGASTAAADEDFDPTEHAARFEALHEALVAVLAEVEHTERSEPVERDHRA